ncbi:MAG: hypothetical protein U9R25_11670 [Chloroflexota bacterium]|nr:hypothetical protein [Chloroflexota bacterium]
MISINSRRMTSLAMLLIIITAVLAGCNLERERTFKLNDDWSRGNRIGTASIRQAVGIDGDDQGTYIMWAERQEEGNRLAVSHLAADGTVISKTVVPISTLFPRRLQIVAGDVLHSFAVTRLQSGDSDGVYYFQLGRDGQIVEGPQRLTMPEQKSAVLSVSKAPDNTMHLVWDVVEGPGKGVYYQRLLPDGSFDGFPQLIGPDGEQPTGAVDEKGVFHAAWITGVTPTTYDLLYASVAPGARTSSEPVRVGDLRIAISDVTFPPTMAVDPSHVYILWSQEHRSGLEQGTAETFYVAFPRGEPGLRVPEPLLVSSEAAPAYRETTEFPPLTEMAYPGESTLGTTFLENPSAVASPGAEFAMVVADMMFDFRFDPRPQTVLLIFQDGQFVAYQQPARTRHYSQQMQGFMSDDGEYHLAWVDLENLGQYSVYYASTREEARELLALRTSNDTALDAMDAMWGMASGISLLPLIAIILLPLIIVCGVFYFTGNDDSIKTSWAAKLTLAISIVLYLGTKIFILAAVVTRPPFYQSVPESLQGIWWLLMFLLVAAVAGLATWIYIRRSSRPYLLRAVFTFALTDSLLTLLLYGPSFFGD